MFITTPRNKKEFNNLLPYIDAFLFGINDYSVNFSNSFTLKEIEEFKNVNFTPVYAHLKTLKSIEEKK